MFIEGHLVSISAVSFSKLTFGFREEDVYLFLYMYIKENGPAPCKPCFSMDQIRLSYFCRRSPCGHFRQIILNSGELFQNRTFFKCLPQ